MIRTSDGKLHFTEKERLHFSKVRKGRPGRLHSNETKNKIGLAHLGRKASISSKRKMRMTALKQYRNGRVVHNKGKSKTNYLPLSIVSKKMIGNKNSSGRFGKLNGMFGRKNPHLKKLNAMWIGGKHTIETKLKMSVKSKASWKKTRNKRIKSLKKVWCKHQSKTYLEKKFIDLCSEFKLPFRYVGNGKFWVTACGVHMNPDFVSTNGSRIFVEVYAKCWKDADYEEIRGKLLKKAGFSTIFISNDILDAEDWKIQIINKLHELGVK